MGKIQRFWTKLQQAISNVKLLLIPSQSLPTVWFYRLCLTAFSVIQLCDTCQSLSMIFIVAFQILIPKFAWWYWLYVLPKVPHRLKSQVLKSQEYKLMYWFWFAEHVPYSLYWLVCDGSDRLSWEYSDHTITLVDLKIYVPVASHSEEPYRKLIQRVYTEVTCYLCQSCLL